MISAAPSPASPLLAHVEPLLRDARVLLVGNAKTQLAEHALARGARLVQVLDFDSRRVAARAAHNAERRISFAQLTDSSLRDAAFDLVVVEDLTVHRDPRKLLAGVRRSLASTGLALIAVAQGSSAQADSAEGRSLSFEDLEDLAMDTFESVTLFGQAPFVGYSVVSLDIDDAPEPTLDNGFLAGEAEEAEVFAALGGSKAALDRVSLEDMTIVQLPAAQLFGQGSEEARDAERRALRHVESLEAELERLRARARTSNDSDHKLADAERQAAESARQAAESARQAEEGVRQAAEATRKLDALEKKLADADRQAALAEAKRREAEEQLDEQRRIAERGKKEARWAEDRVAKLEKELEEALVAAEQATEQSAEAARLAEAAALAAKAQQQATANTDALDELEAELEETHAELLAAHEKLEKRARHVAAVEADLARVRGDLGKAIERADHAERRADKLDKELAVAGREASVEARAEAARLEAQLAERGRHVQELERQLRELEQYGRSLVARLETAREREPSVDAGELTDVKTRLGALERRLAEREADLVSAEWTIGQLEKRLGTRPS